MAATALHPACLNASHPCLPCKLAIWRGEGRTPMTRKRGQALGTDGTPWYDTTIREQQERIIADAKAGGLDPMPVGTRWV